MGNVDVFVGALEHLNGLRQNRHGYIASRPRRCREKLRYAKEGAESCHQAGTIHAVTAYPNQAIVLQVPSEMMGIRSHTGQ